jgi:pimeloyl-ACP methyl ester carboxylesterase
MSPSPGAIELGPAIDGERRRWCPEGHGVGDVCIYAAERGRGRPLVLVHDLRATSSAYEMRPLFECFRWRRPTYALDLPGYGLSQRSSLPYAPALFAMVVAELLRKLRRTDPAVDVAALGRGCEVVARVARDEPALVRSLVMLDPYGLLPMRGALLEAMAAHLGRLLGDGAARTLFGLITRRALVRCSLAARFHGPPDEGLVGYAHASARVPGAHRAPLTTIANGPRGPEAALLYRSLTVPVLVVHDVRGGDAIELEAFLRGRANRFAVRVSPTRGMPHFERRGDTVAALERFWQSIPRAARDRAMR